MVFTNSTGVAIDAPVRFQHGSTVSYGRQTPIAAPFVERNGNGAPVYEPAPGYESATSCGHEPAQVAAVCGSKQVRTPPLFASSSTCTNSLPSAAMVLALIQPPVSGVIPPIDTSKGCPGHADAVVVEKHRT